MIMVASLSLFLVFDDESENILLVEGCGII